MKKLLIVLSLLTVPVVYSMEEGDLPLNQLKLNDQLWGAVYRGNTSEVIKLIEQGANVNKEDGRIPLNYVAAATSNQEMAAVLINRGADVNGRDRNGYTPLDEAAFRGSKEMVEVLLSADRCKVRTEAEIQGSRSRITDLLLCLKEDALPDMLSGLRKKVLLFFPTDVFSVDMLKDLLPLADQEQIQRLAQHCPRAWFVQAVRDLAREKKDEVIQVVIDCAIEQANLSCNCLDLQECPSSYNFAHTEELKDLLDPKDSKKVREQFICKQIEKEFSEERSEEHGGGSKGEEDLMDLD